MNLSEYCLEAAKLFLKAGFRKTAEELLKDRAKRFGSNDTACFVSLAEFYNLHGRPQEAIDVLEKFGTQHDDNTSSVPDCKIWYDVYRERSRAYKRLQDLGESAKWAQRALALSKLYPSIAGSYTSPDK